MRAEAIAERSFLIPISNGILEHRAKIGAAIWLFILLIDWTTSEENGVGKVLGGKPVKLRDLMGALHLRERQVSSQLQRLKAGGYIRLRRSSYGYSIEVMKSKKFVNRDQQKIAGLNKSDQQKTADHNGQTSNKLPIRSATFCRNKEDITVDLTKKSGADRKKRDHADTDPRVKTLLTSFVSKYLGTVGTPYVVVTGKDPALLKRLLMAGHDAAAIESAMDRYLADPFYSKTGFDIGGFWKAYNRLNSAGSRRKHDYEQGAYPTL